MTMKIFYVRDSERRPIGCVAYEVTLQPWSNGTTDNVVMRQFVKVGMSAWDPIDVFDKSVARNVAIGRLQARLSFNLMLDDKRQVREQVLEHVASVCKSSKIRRAITQYLKHNFKPV
jgi:hypothetical protein